MNKPRIAILHYAAPPTIGGVETTIAAHARLFADHGYNVEVVAGRGEGFDPRVPVHIIAHAGSSSARVLEVNAELARGIVSERFHHLVRELHGELLGLADPPGARLCLIVHNVLSLHKNLALTAALKLLADSGRGEIIAWCHDFAWSDPQYAGEVHAGYPWDLIRVPWPGVQYVVVSAERQEELGKLWGISGNIRIVPPGLDPFAFLGVSSQMARWARDLALLDAAPLLLLPARLTRRKNAEYAIEITAALRDQGWPAKLVVSGPPGPHNPTNAAYVEQLRSLREMRGLEEAVIFLHEFGTVDDAALRDLFLLSDVLVFPSEREGFGIPILEAGLSRLPIFCSDLRPFRESALDNAHFLAPGEPPPEAAVQIAGFLARDPGYRLKKRVLTEYAWERIFSEQIEPLVIKPATSLEQ
ncbi:MAG: glycosyltransferase family 4 protein [Acidobacteriota bacterium]